MIYLDNAATGFPKSRKVADAMLFAHEFCGNAGRSGHKLSIQSAETVYECRKNIAKLFNTVPEYVILTSGATEALNIAINGVVGKNDRKGNVTVTSDLEHNSVMRPLYALKQKKQTSIRQFRVDFKNDFLTAERFSYVCRGAKTAVVTHASNVCGKILPIKEMCGMKDKDTVFILDASQSAGHFPIDIRDLGVDIMCIPGHKGLYGPMGTGALIINPESKVSISPLLYGGTGTNSKSYEMPSLYPERLEAGTQNICGIAGLSASVKEFCYPDRESELFRYLVSEMKNMVDIILYGAPNESVEGYVPVLLFNKKNKNCDEVCDILSDNGIYCRAGFHCAPSAHRAIGSYETGGVRVSLGRDTEESDIETFLSVLKTI